jgi:hypothetical protein
MFTEFPDASPVADSGEMFLDLTSPVFVAKVADIKPYSSGRVHPIAMKRVRVAARLGDLRTALRG